MRWTTEDGISMERVTLDICTGCLDAEGDQCHVPECALIRHSVIGELRTFVHTEDALRSTLAEKAQRVEDLETDLAQRDAVLAASHETLDRAEAEVARLNRRTRCDIDGDDHLADTVSDCRMCGAPQCCPVCCREAFDEAEVARLTAERDASSEAVALAGRKLREEMDDRRAAEARAERAEAALREIDARVTRSATPIEEFIDRHADLSRDRFVLNRAWRLTRSVAEYARKALAESGQEGSADE